LARRPGEDVAAARLQGSDDRRGERGAGVSLRRSACSMRRAELRRSASRRARPNPRRSQCFSNVLCWQDGSRCRRRSTRLCQKGGARTGARGGRSVGSPRFRRKRATCGGSVMSARRQTRREQRPRVTRLRLSPCVDVPPARPRTFDACTRKPLVLPPDRRGGIVHVRGP
jgi:hypothetical protein